MTVRRRATTEYKQAQQAYETVPIDVDMAETTTIHTGILRQRKIQQPQGIDLEYRSRPRMSKSAQMTGNRTKTREQALRQTQNNGRDISARPTRTQNMRAPRATEMYTEDDDNLIYSKKSDRMFALLKIVFFVLLGSALVGGIVEGIQVATLAYTRQIYGPFPTTHADFAFGFPNETPEHLTHVIAINDHGTISAIVFYPNGTVESFPLSQYTKQDPTLVPILSQTKFNGMLCVEIHAGDTIWYLKDTGKRLDHIIV